MVLEAGKINTYFKELCYEENKTGFMVCFKLDEKVHVYTLNEIIQCGEENVGSMRNGHCKVIE